MSIHTNSDLYDGKNLMRQMNEKIERDRLIAQIESEVAVAVNLTIERQVTRNDEIIGKTIKAVHNDFYAIVFIYTDGAYTRLRSVQDYDGLEIEFDPLTPYDAHRFGILSDEEYEQYRKAMAKLKAVEEINAGKRNLLQAVQTLGEAEVRKLLGFNGA